VPDVLRSLDLNLTKCNSRKCRGSRLTESGPPLPVTLRSSLPSRENHGATGSHPTKLVCDRRRSQHDFSLAGACLSRIGSTDVHHRCIKQHGRRFPVPDTGASAVTTFKLILAELVRPSNRHAVGRFRRFAHRLFVLLCVTAALFVCTIWMYSYIPPVDRSECESWWRNGDVEVYFNTAGIVFVQMPFTGHGVFVHDGRLDYLTKYDADHEIAVLHNRDVEFLGAQWKQGTIRSCTRGFRRHIVLPLWMPFVLFAACPVIAFIRGPYRRATRRATGFCRRCGYNLTGLVEPRCPECGTGMSPKQINQVMSVSVQD